MPVPYCTERMAHEYGLPEWLPRVFTGGRFSREFNDAFDPILGAELSESYRAQPELYRRLREGVPDNPYSGYNHKAEEFLAPIALVEGKTVTELLFGLAPGHESLAISGDMGSLAGILLLKPQPLEHVRALLEHQTRRFLQMGMSRRPEWSDAWQFGGRGEVSDPLAKYAEWVTRVGHAATAIRAGYRGAELDAYIFYEEVVLELAVQEVSVRYAVSLITAMDAVKGKAFRVRASDMKDFVLHCWQNGVPAEYAVLTVPTTSD